MQIWSNMVIESVTKAERNRFNLVLNVIDNIIPEVEGPSLRNLHRSTKLSRRLHT